MKDIGDFCGKLKKGGKGGKGGKGDKKKHHWAFRWINNFYGYICIYL